MASSQVSMSIPEGPHRRLTAYRAHLAADLDRVVTFAEAIDRAVEAGEAARAAKKAAAKEAAE